MVDIDEACEIGWSYYFSNATSYVFDDINGIRRIFPKENSIIEIYPMVAEIIYKDGIQEQKEKYRLMEL
jgi:hypothetical protein